ncbi:beta-galactosidase [Roseococcus sp. DSY-14]|uniref:beta-galactosidase n=1 Tax=Roseococcus sp. DSY-14 TaxID=3369650 RepID=UPI00387AC274
MPFRSFALGGFEGSTHRRRDRRRVDTIASSAHDLHAARDYALMRELGIGATREALRWHLIEPAEGRYDWSSVLPILRAARAHGVEVVWDVCHWGVPEGLDVMSTAFPARAARLARAFARLLREEGAPAAGWVPMNEMSFWAWAGGDMGHFEPWLEGQGDALKRQLFHGHLAVVEALRAAGERAPVIVAEPLINVVPEPGDPEAARLAAGHNEGSFAIVDWLLAADRSSVDVVGFNHYPHNQWVWDGPQIWWDDGRFRRLASLLADAHRRFRKPLMLAETGAEEPRGDAWMGYVAEEVARALDAGVPVEGVCIYPIMDYAGWDNDRHVPCGPLRRDAVQHRHLRPGQAAAVRALNAIPARRRDARAA